MTREKENQASNKAFDMHTYLACHRNSFRMSRWYLFLILSLSPSLSLCSSCETLSLIHLFPLFLLQQDVCPLLLHFHCNIGYMASTHENVKIFIFIWESKMAASAHGFLEPSFLLLLLPLPWKDVSNLEKHARVREHSVWYLCVYVYVCACVNIGNEWGRAQTDRYSSPQDACEQGLLAMTYCVTRGSSCVMSLNSSGSSSITILRSCWMASGSFPFNSERSMAAEKKGEGMNRRDGLVKTMIKKREGQECQREIFFGWMKNLLPFQMSLAMWSCTSYTASLLWPFCCTCVCACLCLFFFLNRDVCWWEMMNKQIMKEENSLAEPTQTNTHLHCLDKVPKMLLPLWQDTSAASRSCGLQDVWILVHCCRKLDRISYALESLNGV